MSVTEEFIEAFPRSGHIVMDCGVCNRTHFTDDEGAGDWNEGELEDLRAKAKAAPDSYVMHADWVSATDVGLGTPVPDDCPCGGIERYERWIWERRDSIARYLRARIAADQQRHAVTIAALG